VSANLVNFRAHLCFVYGIRGVKPKVHVLLLECKSVRLMDIFALAQLVPFICFFFLNIYDTCALPNADQVVFTLILACLLVWLPCSSSGSRFFGYMCLACFVCTAGNRSSLSGHCFSSVSVIRWCNRFSHEASTPENIRTNH
jgi:hypothetical protein